MGLRTLWYFLYSQFLHVYVTVLSLSCSTAFQPAAQEVDIVGPPTYAITDDSTVIQITIIVS